MTGEGTAGSHEIVVETLARVEGEGAMRIATRDGEVTDVQLRIYEPPRFFESFLRGRGHTSWDIRAASRWPRTTRTSYAAGSG